jgi:hypothetical protein
MATRARIGIKREDGTIISAYQHWDGYLAGLGYNLCENWTNPEKVLKAIQLGGASKWGQIIGKKIDFDDRHNEMHDVQNVYYGRDRGEKLQGPRTFKNEAEYLAEGFDSGEEYIYLMRIEGEQDYLGQPQGTWYYAASTYTKDDKITPTQFKPLEEDAILDHIESLKRHLQSIKI